MQADVGGVIELILIVFAFIAWIGYKLFHKQPTGPQPDWRSERRQRDSERRQREDADRRVRAQIQKKLVQESRRIAPEILGRNSSLTHQFLQIAERKVAALDDYGDENWGVLDAEILRCIEKIASAERGHISCGYSKRKRDIAIRPRRISDVQSNIEGGSETDRTIKQELAELAELSGSWSGRRLEIERSEQYDRHALYSELFYILEERFRAYHIQQSSHVHTAEQVGRMTGVEFENYLMRTLKEHGCTVSGTPTTGDRGADIIAQFSGRTIVIQAKRSNTPVGNRAIQEVVAALAYYRGTEAWVMTNSTFTDAARELAQSNGVRLLGGADLALVGQFIV
jgi:hypothetical protein